MLRFFYAYIDVKKFGNYMFNFVLRCLFKNSIDITTSILRRWLIVWVISKKFGAGLGDWVCSRWLCGVCVCVCRHSVVV